MVRGEPYLDKLYIPDTSSHTVEESRETGRQEGICETGFRIV